MKTNWMQFFMADWVSDPAVRMCSPASRGVWMEFICAMALSDRSGSISGNRPALARLAACSSEELNGALNEFTLNGTANVTEDCHGIVTVTNRRMQRESKQRETDAKRQQRWREPEHRNGCVTPDVTALSRSPLLKEVRREKEEDYSKPSTEGGATGGNPAAEGGETQNTKTQTPTENPLRGRQTDVARLCELVLNGQWRNDAGKWVERIRADPEKVWRVMSDVKNAIAEKRVRTTPGQMAESNWKIFK